MNAELKARVIEMVEQLSGNATRKDLQYAIDVHQAIDARVADLEAGRVFTSDQFRQHFGLKPQT
jgi:hypothetical protein